MHGIKKIEAELYGFSCRRILRKGAALTVIQKNKHKRKQGEQLLELPRRRSGDLIGAPAQKIQGRTIFTCGIISVNRKILVGYSQAIKCNTALAKEAVQKAIAQYGIPDMIMTDRGAQFTSKDFYDMMENLKIAHSMSRPHNAVVDPDGFDEVSEEEDREKQE